MKYENEQEQQGDGEHITLERPLKKNLKIQPVLTHIQLGQIN
jgi:hypothetical protein